MCETGRTEEWRVCGGGVVEWGGGCVWGGRWGGGVKRATEMAGDEDGPALAAITQCRVELRAHQHKDKLSQGEFHGQEESVT